MRENNVVVNYQASLKYVQFQSNASRVQITFLSYRQNYFWYMALKSIYCSAGQAMIIDNHQDKDNETV